jgi:hypothetical protein
MTVAKSRSTNVLTTDPDIESLEKTRLFSTLKNRLDDNLETIYNKTKSLSVISREHFRKKSANAIVI